MKAKVVGVIIALAVVVGGVYAALSLTRVGQGEVPCVGKCLFEMQEIG